MRLIEKRISDRRVQKLIRKWLKVGISEEGVVRTSERGTPQGGVISPLLANIYLDVFDRYWKNYGSRYGELLRYADDFVILCESRQRAERGYKVTQQILRKLKLKLQEEKTKIVNMNEEGFEFLVELQPSYAG
jgi:retron-type reverse transcriptase